MTKIIKIEEHLYENKNHTVRVEYRVFKDAFVYVEKTKSQLTRKEREFPKTQIFHF